MLLPKLGHQRRKFKVDSLTQAEYFVLPSRMVGNRSWRSGRDYLAKS
jgi:hypothetical protein